MRKLKNNDRLVRPATKYVEMFRENPLYLARGIAAALHYDFIEDPEANEIQAMIEQKGIQFAIERTTGIKPGTDLFEMIQKQYEEIALKKIQLNQFKAVDYYDKSYVYSCSRIGNSRKTSNRACSNRFKSCSCHSSAPAP